MDPDDGIDPDRLQVLRRACRWPEHPEILAGLVEEFAASGMARLERLRAAVAAGDAAEVAALAHGLKGSSATFGARVVAGLAAEMEHAAGRGTAAAAGLLDRTAEALQRALEVLRGAAGGTDGAP